MAGFDINNNFTGSLFGKDRQGFITPDAEASETLRPFFPVPYPAPYLKIKRRDQGHPVLAGVVLTSQELVGVDASGAFVPAGLFCGTQNRQGKATITNVALTSNVVTVTATNNYVAGDVVTVAAVTNTAINGTFTVVSATSSLFTYALTHANIGTGADTGKVVLVSDITGKAAGTYCIIEYTSYDVGFTYNAISGNLVTAGGQVAVLAAPSDAAAGDVYTFADGTTYTLLSGDITSAQACTLFSGGVVKPIGLTLRNAWQYIGGVNITTTTGGMHYTLDGVNPVGMPVLNFKYEMGIPIQTEMVIRLPWIGTSDTALTTFAAGDSISGYAQGQGRTFVHYVGTPNPGDVVCAARGGNGVGNGAGNYTSYNSAVHSFSDITGKILGIQNMYPIRDFANRVRTLYDPSRLVGPITDPNPISIQMGGSATSGIPTQINLTTDGIFNLAYKQGKTLRPEYSTYVLVAVRTF